MSNESEPKNIDHLLTTRPEYISPVVASNIEGVGMDYHFQIYIPKMEGALALRIASAVGRAAQEVLAKAGVVSP